MIPDWGGDIFYIIPINAYPVYINASLMQKGQVDEDRENLHSHTRCVGYMKEGCGGKEGGAYRKRRFVGWLTDKSGHDFHMLDTCDDVRSKVP